MRKKSRDGNGKKKEKARQLRCIKVNVADYRGQYLSTERGFCLSEANNRTKVKQRLWEVLLNMGECACMFMHEYFSLILI